MKRASGVLAPVRIEVGAGARGGGRLFGFAGLRAPEGRGVGVGAGLFRGPRAGLAHLAQSIRSSSSVIFISTDLLTV